jgi:hypothetical protein
MLAGCDKKDSDGVAIAKARNTLEALDTGGSAAPASNRSERFAEAAKAVASITGTDPSAALAQALGGTAILGQAELAQATYRQTDGDLLRLVAAARAKLSLYQRQSGLAASLSNYNPQPEIDGYQQVIAQRNKELAGFESELRANDAKVADLRARAKHKSDQGRAMRESSASLEQSLLSADSASRPGLAEQVRQARRQADAVLKDADLLEVQAERIAPTSGELQLKVQQARRQIESLERAIAGARERDQSMKRQSAEASKAADAAGIELQTAMQAVVAHANDVAKPAFDAAVSLIAQATSKLNAGRAGGGAAQQTSIGLAAHAEAAFRREYAEAMARVAAVLADAGAATPAAPGADEFISQSKAFADLRDASNQAALEAYERARTSFGSSGSGATGERLQRLSTAIDAFLIERGLKKPEAAPEPAPAEPAADQPAGETTPAGETPSDPANAPAEPTNPDEPPAGDASAVDPAATEPAPTSPERW